MNGTDAKEDRWSIYDPLDNFRRDELHPGDMESQLSSRGFQMAIISVVDFNSRELSRDLQGHDTVLFFRIHIPSWQRVVKSTVLNPKGALTEVPTQAREAPAAQRDVFRTQHNILYAVMVHHNILYAVMTSQ